MLLEQLIDTYLWIYVQSNVDPNGKFEQSLKIPILGISSSKSWESYVWLCLMYMLPFLAGRRHLFDLFMDFRGPALYSNGREEDWKFCYSKSPYLSFLDSNTGQRRSSAKKELDGDRSFIICQQLCLAASPRKSAGGRRGRTPTISKWSDAEI